MEKSLHISFEVFESIESLNDTEKTIRSSEGS